MARYENSLVANFDVSSVKPKAARGDWLSITNVVCMAFNARHNLLAVGQTEYAFFQFKWRSIVPEWPLTSTQR